MSVDGSGVYADGCCCCGSGASRFDKFDVPILLLISEVWGAPELLSGIFGVFDCLNFHVSGINFVPG